MHSRAALLGTEANRFRSQQCRSKSQRMQRHSAIINRFKRLLAPAWCMALVTVLAVPQTAMAAPNARALAAAKEKAPGQSIAKQADQILREVGAYIGSAKAFTVHADIMFDHVLPSGQKLQFSANEEIVVERPDRLYVEWTGDLGVRRFWYDRKSITLYNPGMPFYASQDAPGAIDGMLAMLIANLNFTPPLSDIVLSDPYNAIRKNIEYGFDLGDNEVDGRSCRTLSFVGKTVDIQLWVENGPRPTPCKVLITYKLEPSQPQFAATFSDWDFAPRIDDRVFVPDLPPGTEKIPFVKISAAR